MRIAIIAMGTRGDVQPYGALGRGLRNAGHAVRLLTHENFAAFVQGAGLEFYPMRGDVQAVADSPEMRALLEKGDFLAISRFTAQAARSAALVWAEDGLAACTGMDLLIAGMGGLFTALALAEKLRIPLLQAYVVPFSPTDAFAGVLAPAGMPALGGVANRLSHHLMRQLMWQGFRSADAAARRQVLNLPAPSFWGPYSSASLQGQPVLYGFSPLVIPKPADWPASLHVTGFWFVDSGESWTPPASLTDFLDAGPPPVSIGFGSMTSRNPQETAAIVLQALAESDQRAVLLSGWGGLHLDGIDPQRVYVADAIPHDWLFPHMAAVVHHGGAGTTAAGLAAGVPSVVVPFFGDQPFWGRRVAELGVGTEPIARKKLTAGGLAAALRQATTDLALRQRAAALGAAIRREDGIGRAVAVIDSLAVDSLTKP